MGAIEADHYREEVDNLKKDPIVIKMADELWDAPQDIKDKFWDHNGNPTMQFMLTANKGYNAVALEPFEPSTAPPPGTKSIGGVAKAITALHKERVENK